LTPSLNGPTLNNVSQQEQPLPPNLVEPVRLLVDANRVDCLWFMKEDFYPSSVREADRALAEIELHGDLKAWTQARNLRAWLSQNISAES
jgi:hypothetical protein